MRVIGRLALAVTMATVTPVSAQTRSKPAMPPSQKTVKRAQASGSAKAAGPFEFKISGAKTATVTGNDAGFCMSPGPVKDSQIFALSLVENKWAISVTAMRPRPAVGKHAVTGDLMEGIMADVIDKTTGSEPQQWVHRDVQSGALTITTSTPTRLAGTLELVAKTSAGELRVAGKFDAPAVKC